MDHRRLRDDKGNSIKAILALGSYSMLAEITERALVASALNIAPRSEGAVANPVVEA